MGPALSFAAALLIAPPATPEPEPPTNPDEMAEPEIEPLGEYHDRLVEALAVQPGGLTSDEVAVEAVVTSPFIEVKRAELMRTAATVDETISRFAPDVSGTASYTRISQAPIEFGSGGASLGALNEGPVGVGPCPGNPGQNCVVDSMGMPVIATEFGSIEVPLNNWSLQASLSVPFSDYALRLMPAYRGANAETRAAIDQREAEKQSVELDARIAYYDWVRSLAQVSVAQQTVESTAARLEDARVGLVAGTATTADVLRLDGLVADAEAAVQAAESFAELARENLALIMGRDDSAFVVGEDVLGPIDPLPNSGDREALIDEAMDNRLELRALANSREVMEYARKAAMANYFPRLDGFANATYANPNQRFFPATNEWNADWAVGVSLSWRLSTFLQGRSNVKLAKANERVVVANHAAMRRAIELEVNAAWQERRRAMGAIELNTRSAQAAAAAYEQQVALYQAGEATTTDVIESEIQRLNSTLRAVNSRIDLRVANAKLMRATGRMKPIEVPADADDARYEKVGPGKRRVQ